MEKQLDQLVSKLKQAAGANLKAVVLYGSAASGEFHPKHSDLNVLCVLERLDTFELEKLNPATVGWTRKGHPAPFVFGLEELRQSAHVFAIELWDIKAARRVLFGEDVIAGLDVPMTLHGLQVERELRTNLIRLRQHFLASPSDAKSLLRLMTVSTSAFVTLFRHALVVLGEPPPPQKREAVNSLEALLGVDMVSFRTILDIREGNRKARHVDAVATFRGYLESVTRVVEEVDRRLGSRAQK